MTAGIEIENESRDPDYAHFRGGLSSIGYRFYTFHRCAKFDDSSLNRFRYIIAREPQHLKCVT